MSCHISLNILEQKQLTIGPCVTLTVSNIPLKWIVTCYFEIFERDKKIYFQNFKNFKNFKNLQKLNAKTGLI